TRSTRNRRRSAFSRIFRYRDWFLHPRRRRRPDTSDRREVFRGYARRNIASWSFLPALDFREHTEGCFLFRQFLPPSKKRRVSICSRSNCASGSFASAIVRNRVGLRSTFSHVDLQITHSWLSRPALTASANFSPSL